jgi:hypothetical protein
VGGGFLYVAQRHAGVQGGGDEGVPQGVRPAGLGDPGAAGDPADDPSGAVPVQPAAGRGEDHWSLAALADREVDGPGGARGERDGDDLAALAGDHQGLVAALGAHGVDVGAGDDTYQVVQRSARPQLVRAWGIGLGQPGA